MFSQSALPTPSVTTGIDSTVNAGSEHTLECRVLEIPNLVTQPKLEWLEPGGTVLARGNGILLTSSLYFVNTSDAGQYICHVTVTIESV